MGGPDTVRVFGPRTGSRSSVQNRVRVRVQRVQRCAAPGPSLAARGPALSRGAAAAAPGQICAELRADPGKPGTLFQKPGPGSVREAVQKPDPPSSDPERLTLYNREKNQDSDSMNSKI